MGLLRVEIVSAVSDVLSPAMWGTGLWEMDDVIRSERSPSLLEKAVDIWPMNSRLVASLESLSDHIPRILHPSTRHIPILYNTQSPIPPWWGGSRDQAAVGLEPTTPHRVLYIHFQTVIRLITFSFNFYTFLGATS